MKHFLGGGLLAGVLFVVGCGGGGAKPTPRCIVNSDCKANSLYVCVQGYCVSPCVTSRDCPSGERCIVVVPAGASDADGGAATPAQTTCQPFEKATCYVTGDCTSPLVCAGDRLCRNQCTDDTSCAGEQRCTSVSHLCADPSRDTDYNSTTNEFTSTGAGGTGAGGSSAAGSGGGGSSGGSGGGSGGNDGGAGKGTGGADGGGGMACTPTQFGSIAVSDSKPGYTSGVGLRAATEFLTFSGYRGPDPTVDAGSDAAPATVVLVYVQSFDLATGKSNGPAAPLLSITNPPTLPYLLFVDDVAIAPTGEIALLFNTTDGNFDARLYATFLTTAGGDAGVGGVSVLRTVQIESVTSSSQRVIWSAGSQSFVASWEYVVNGLWVPRLRTFLPDGRGGTAVDIVPAPPSSSRIDDGRVGASGNLFGVTTRTETTNLPFLTVLTTDGTQVGDFIQLSANPVGLWAVTGGTTKGFVSLFGGGATAYGVFVPTAGDNVVIPDGGASDAGSSADAADAAVVPPFAAFSFPSSATTAQAISDDTGGLGGVGAVLLGPTGASFLYVTADGSKHMGPGAVISSHNGAEVAISNYHGSFAVSLYDGTSQTTQVSSSACGP